MFEMFAARPLDIVDGTVTAYHPFAWRITASKEGTAMLDPGVLEYARPLAMTVLRLPSSGGFIKTVVIMPS
jgi:hypothetical protein